MSKFNNSTIGSNKTTNKSGYTAYSMSNRDKLVTAVLTTMFGEPKFYGNNDNEIVRLAATVQPDFVAKLAVYARQVMNLCSVSHVLAAVIAHEHHEYTRAVIRNVVVRPDDMAEIMSCYKSLYGKPFPNAMKREIANCFNRFSEYQLAKYNSNSKELKLRDMLRITHPVPQDEKTSEIFNKILNNTLETPYTWETELSARGNTREVWNDLIYSGKVNYMALLRNLRNIALSGADIEPVLAKLSDPEEIRKSRQLPFRFFSAFSMLDREHLLTPQIWDALEKAISVSIDGMEHIPGRSLIAIDHSGSMGSAISAKSTVTCAQIATLLGVMANRICDSATICYFNSSNRYDWNTFGNKGYTIAKYDKYDSILETVKKNCNYSGGTDLSLPMQYALENSKYKPFDRVIYFSDNECNTSYGGLRSTTQRYAEEYRRNFNPDFWVHGIDLQGYGTQQFCGKKFNLIAGWSDVVLPFINTAEQGIGTIIDAINNINLDKR